MIKKLTVNVLSNGAQKTLARDKRGGYLLASVEAIHTWKCPIARRLNKLNKGKPCNCGASQLYADWKVTP